MNIARKYLITGILITITTLPGCASIMASLSQPGTIDTPQDSRTLGTYVEDENIEIKVKANLYNNNEAFKNTPFSVTSFNHVVLLTGQVESENLREQASSIAKNIRAVRQVHNEMTVGEPLSLGEQIQDHWLATKIKTHMIVTKDFPASKVLVVTEAGIVYLMGLLTQEQADWATAIVSNVHGVRKIIKIIEYLPTQQQATPDKPTPANPHTSYPT